MRSLCLVLGLFATIVSAQSGSPDSGRDDPDRWYADRTNLASARRAADLWSAALRRDRDAKLGHDEQVPPRVAPEDRATEPARDLSHLGEDVPEGGVLAPPGQAEPEPGTGERSP